MKQTNENLQEGIKKKPVALRTPKKENPHWLWTQDSWSLSTAGLRISAEAPITVDFLRMTVRSQLMQTSAPWFSSQKPFINP